MLSEGGVGVGVEADAAVGGAGGWRGAMCADCRRDEARECGERGTEFRSGILLGREAYSARSASWERSGG